MTPIQFKRERMKLHMTVAELAEKMMVDRSTITRWENGQRSVPKPIIVLLGYIKRENKNHAG